jgi:hypothetical protein
MLPTGGFNRDKTRRAIDLARSNAENREAGITATPARIAREA